VLHPVDDLREATKQIAQGRFDYRIQPRSRDELGQLASEVNQMAATIVDMQTKMIEQERLAAAGEMVTRLAHNIRNPLAGIRGLSETTLQLNQDDAETVGCQERIIATVDRFEKWLRDLQQSVSPLTIQPKPVAIEALLADTLAALQPMLDRHNVSVEKQVDPNLKHVSVDGGHFEQAVVSLVTNAIQASNRGQTVRLRVEGVPGDSGHWRFSVEDEGAGVPAELREKIFEPYFTTKPDGNGIGLSTARKVVRLHGGQLSVESEEGRGSRFEMYMPGADKDT
jgi:signal transduction histidine kinase